ncbi:MAG: chorismate mutase [Actinomycetes bacterium]|jgi:chorismate mutase|nr:chorismate mutase [Actinomycetes bacterium]
MTDDITRLRARLDALDGELVTALNERARLSLAVRALKQDAALPLYDPARESRILERVGELNAGPLYDEQVQEVFRAILKVMKEARA